MARTADPGRKPELVESILEHLLDAPLATVTFRSLAGALGVSTYTLVYHFGTRASLIAELVNAVSARQLSIQQSLLAEDATIDDYFTAYRTAWAFAGSPVGRRRGLIDFEAALLAVRGDGAGPAVEAYQRWLAIGIAALTRFGMSEPKSSVTCRAMIAAMHGLKYDYVITGDAEATAAAFEHLLATHRQSVLAQLDEA